jgi:hypothetical protein
MGIPDWMLKQAGDGFGPIFRKPSKGDRVAFEFLYPAVGL